MTALGSGRQVFDFDAALLARDAVAPTPSVTLALERVSTPGASVDVVVGWVVAVVGFVVAVVGFFVAVVVVVVVVGFVGVVTVVGLVVIAIVDVVAVVGCVVAVGWVMVVVVLDVGVLTPPTGGMEGLDIGVGAEGVPPVRERAMAAAGSNAAIRAITATNTAEIDRRCRTFCRQSKPCH